MFAHRIAAFTGPDDVVWTEVADPSGGVVVDVAAAGVSFADLLQTRGAYQMRVALPYTPGMDAAGVVRSGAGFSPGQRVAVLVPHGCWQEVISAPAERVGAGELTVYRPAGDEGTNAHDTSCSTI